MSDHLEFVWDHETASSPLLRLRGRLDVEGAQQLQDVALQSLRESDSPHLIIDLEGVEFVASTGLATFLLLTEVYADECQSVVFVKAAPAVKQVISLLNIDQFLKLESSEEAAVQLLAKSGEPTNTSIG